MLIDAGNNNNGAGLVEYLKNLGINRLDYLVGTHPHEDHIGGMDSVITNFDIGKIMIPKVSNSTQTFEDVLRAISEKGLKVTTPVAGSTFSLGAATFTVLSPSRTSYTEINEYSVVLRMTIGSTSVLFCGDADDLNENDMVDSGLDLAADVIKVGHHGSSSSTSQAFLEAVSPRFAIISVGSGNQYGHPTEQTLSVLTSLPLDLFRTDTDGTVVLSIENGALSFSKVITEIDGGGTTNVATPVPVVTKPATGGGGTTVYITATGEKYHVGSCRYLSKSKIAISLADAKSRGYAPCSVCDPPQ